MRKSQIQNLKSQISPSVPCFLAMLESKFQISNFKFQTFGSWCLEFVIYLELGA